MKTSDANSGKMVSFGRKLAMGLIIAALALSGCHRASTKADDPLQGSKKEEQKEIQDESSRKAGAVVKREGIILQKPVLSPAVVSAGGTIRQELKYSVFSAETGKLKITEVIVLSGKGLKVELSKKVQERTQGDNVSTFQFILPKDLPSGEYHLITAISFGKERKNATGSFRVKR